MRELLKAPECAVGMIVTGFVVNEDDTRVAILLGEDKALLVHSRSGYDYSALEFESEMSIAEWIEFGKNRALAAGLISQEAIERHKAEQEAQSSAYAEERDRREYERLRKKFEGA